MLTQFITSAVAIKLYSVFYPTIAALCASNQTAMYTIAIYGRLYTTE